MKTVLSTLFIYLSASLSSAAYAHSDTPKNIIMLVGDGMGPAYTSAYRYYQDDANTPQIEQTVFDRHLVGLSSTYPAPVSGYVTDSAAAATALATGVKSYNGAISVDVEKKPVESVLIRAKKQGKKTGIIATLQINHATPAAYIAHNESRRNYNQIADSYFDRKVNNGFTTDLMFGGGWQYFMREDRNLVEEFKQAGFHYLDNYQALAKLPKNKPVLGLFADKGLPQALDDSDKYRLTTMTKAAVAQLENKQGYFLLVEASQIDWGGHYNDISYALAELDDLAKTMEYLETYVKNNPDTLVVLTADHSTGGFTVGANGVYKWQPEVLRSMLMSATAIGDKLSQISFDQTQASQWFNFALTTKEFEQLTQDKTAGQLALQSYGVKKDQSNDDKQPPSLADVMQESVKTIIDERTNTGWTSGGHTAIDVPVYAMGQGKERFIGMQDNTDIAKKLFKLLGRH
jgi:alkaline phosphatase